MLLALALSSLAHADSLTLRELAALDTSTESLGVIYMSLGWEPTYVHAELDARLDGGLTARTELTCAVDEAAGEAACWLDQITRTRAGEVVQRDSALLDLAFDRASGTALYTGANDGSLLGFRSTAAAASALVAGAGLALMGDEPYIGGLPDAVRVLLQDFYNPHGRDA